MRNVIVSVASAALVMMLVPLYGCGQTLVAPEEAEKASAEKPRKVVVNEGLSREEEQELSQRLEELEEKVEAEEKADSRQEADQPQESSEPAYSEEDVLAAAEAYYQAVGVEDWGYTYENLDDATKVSYTEGEWFQKNQYFADNGTVIYHILSAERRGGTQGPIAEVTMRLTYGDGSTSERSTYFIYEDGGWKHRFGEEENYLFMPDASYAEFVAAQGGSASASSSASASASASSPASPSATGLKHVEVIVTSDVPVDVSIMDDSAEWIVTEEISGTRNYENDIASGSGLSVSAMNKGMNMRGNVSIEVYENGELRTQDSDSSGFAQVMY